MSNCRTCGAEIVWMKTRAGKNIPVDVPKFEKGEIANEAVLTATEFNPKTMKSHFATCPDAQKWRKKDEPKVS